MQSLNALVVLVVAICSKIAYPVNLLRLLCRGRIGGNQNDECRDDDDYLPDHGLAPVFDHSAQKYLFVDVPIISHPVDPVVANATITRKYLTTLRRGTSRVGVRFGSTAEVGDILSHVCFSPNTGHKPE